MRGFELALRTRRTNAPYFPLEPLAKCAGPVKLDELDDWMASKETCRSVLAAFPPGFFENSKTGQILALDHAQNVGTSQWWLTMLFRANTRIAQRFRCDKGRLEFETTDDEVPSWVPGPAFAQKHGIDQAKYALLVRPGLQIDAFRYNFSTEDDLHMEDAAAVARVHSLLKFGKTGAGRAVLALFRIFEEADYVEKFSDVWNEPPPDLFEPRGEIRAIIAVSPHIVFRLSDVLRCLHQDEAHRHNEDTEAKRQLFQMTIFVARKIRAAADAGCFKLDMTPEDIVFASTLVECDKENYAETGFEHDTRSGMPFIDPTQVRFTAHGLPAENADCAYLAMVLALLASVRTGYGAMLQHVMMRHLRSQNLNGSPIPENEHSADYAQFNLEAVAQRIGQGNRWKGFALFMKTMLPAYVVGRRRVCEAALHEASDDFMDLIKGEALHPSTRWTKTDNRERVAWNPQKPIFSKLTILATGRSIVSTALFALPFAEPSETISRGEAAIRQLVRQRQERLRIVNVQ